MAENHDQRILRLIICACATILGFGLFLAAIVFPRFLDRSDWSRGDATVLVIAALACLLIGLLLYPRRPKH